MTKDDRQHLVETIRDAIIGEDRAIRGPFGMRRVTYADYTASGRSIAFIEDYIRQEVLPLYANTHTETSGTGLQTTQFREEARQIIHRSVGGGDDDVVVFCGSGSTGAIDRVVDMLNIRIPADLDQKYGLSARVPADERPVVFIGPYEHHSNELPWRESLADVVVIEEDADGRVHLERLREALEEHAERPLKIGSFSAASNVTGIESEIGRITELLHEHGALAFWDFAAAAPYVEIDMSPEGAPERHLDAIFLSPHKFVGGPGTPGVLVAKKALFCNRVPGVPGGGTVSYVSPVEHRYIGDPAHREEGGTPAIVESIRAGLVFQLKQSVGTDLIETLEHGLIRSAIESWDANPNIRILGSKTAPRLSIVSFLVRHGENGYLHHNFVVALLNDLFGIQARGGCSCAGPYGHRLLGIDLTTSEEFEREIVCGFEGIKPGWVRMNFNYFISDEVFDFLIEAVHLVANEGWKLLPLYEIDPITGTWRHRDGLPEPAMSLHTVTYRCGRMEYRSRHATEPLSALESYLDEARETFANAASLDTGNLAAPRRPPSEGYEKLRWFPLPEEAAWQLRAADESAPVDRPSS